MRTVNIHAAKIQLSRLVEAAAGEEIIIVKAGRPIARLVPLANIPAAWALGILTGRVRVPDDFDAPLPNEVFDDFEGRSQDQSGAVDWTGRISKVGDATRGARC